MTMEKVNVYDFDNTIYDGETLVDIILYFIRRDPAIRKYIPKLLWIAFRDRFHLFTVEEAIRAYAGFLETYYVQTLKKTDIRRITEDFWDKNEHKIKPWYAQVRRDDDIIVSGTTDFILDEAAKRLGFRRYVGSAIDPETGKFTRLCFLDNKVRIFRALFPETEIANFYTDSMNDRAMMDIAEHVYLVKKDKITKIR